MKIAVVTIATRNLNFRDYTIDNSRDYCRRHGYDFILYEERIDPTVAIITNKTIGVLENIDNYDWILMKDADSLFYNFTYKIEDYIDDEYNYIGSKSKIEGHVNLGHLLIKCTPETKTELLTILPVIKERVVIKGEQPIYNEFWNEEKISPVKKLEKQIFNAAPFGKENWNEWLSWEELEERVNQNINYERYSDIINDTFIVHYPGNFLKTRDELLDQQIYRNESSSKYVWNFSDSYLLEFISMYNRIKEKFPNKINRKTVFNKIPYGTRVKKSERKKIKYKKG